VHQFALVYHCGRRSGRAYVTPVGARPIADGFVIPMTFGEGADWVQNVQAANSGTIQWNGTNYLVADPVIVDWVVARPAFHRLERVLIPRLGITRFVRLTTASGGLHADTSSRPGKSHDRVI
jgi:deazaflavin-dependent oxidoreductase (nitroreductase family)